MRKVKLIAVMLCVIVFCTMVAACSVPVTTQQNNGAEADNALEDPTQTSDKAVDEKIVIENVDASSMPQAAATPDEIETNFVSSNLFIGSWIADEENNSVYTFNEDGTFVLGNQRGIFVIDGDHAVLSVVNDDGTRMGDGVATIDADGSLIVTMNDSVSMLKREGSAQLIGEVAGVDALAVGQTAEITDDYSAELAANTDISAPEEVTDDTANVEPQTQIVQNDVTDDANDVKSYSDTELQINVTYPTRMNVLNGFLYGALTISDGNGGFMVARDVTGWHDGYDGSNEEFVMEYFNTYLINDFNAFYSDGYDPKFGSFSYSVADSAYICSASLSINNSCTDKDVVCCLIRLETDKSARVIAKMCYAQNDDNDQMRALCDSIMLNMLPDAE